MKFKNILVIIIGSTGSLLSYLIGGFDRLMIALLVFMVIDFLTALILALIFSKSKKTKSGGISSEAGIKGIAKKIFIIFLIALSTQLDIVLGTTIIRDGVIVGFISMEGISILENTSLAGVPIPKILRNALEVLNKKGKDKNE